MFKFSVEAFSEHKKVASAIGASSNEDVIANRFRQKSWPLRCLGKGAIRKSVFAAWRRQTEEDWIDKFGRYSILPPEWALDLRLIFTKWRGTIWKARSGPQRVPKELTSHRQRELEKAKGRWPDKLAHVQAIGDRLEEIETLPKVKIGRGGTLKRRAARVAIMTRTKVEELRLAVTAEVEDDTLIASIAEICMQYACRNREESA